MKRTVGIVALVGLLMAIMSFREGLAGLKDPVDLYAMETNVSEVGYFDMVKVDVFEVYGAFLTRTTMENGKSTNRTRYYVIPAHEGDEYRYVGIKVNESEFETFDKIYDDTYDNYANYDEYYDVVKVGCLKKMSPKIQNYYYDALREAGWFESEEEMKELALPYYLDPMKNPNAMVILFFVGMLMFSVGGILFVLCIRAENVAYKKAMGQIYVEIDGKKYSKSCLAHVNKSVRNKDYGAAVQEMAKVTGLSQEKATEVIERWREYYF